MDRSWWSRPTTNEIMARRAGGRRHYNLACGWHQGRVARVLGVSESTISRDLQRMGLRGMAEASRWLRRH